MSGTRITVRNPMLWAGVALVAVGGLLSSVAVVPETRQALVLRMGKPVRVANAYDPRDGFGATGAGLLARVPLVEQLLWVDKRVLDLDLPHQAVLAADGRPLTVDGYARYRIVDPVRMYAAAGTEQRVNEALRPVLSAALRDEYGRRPFAALLAPEHGDTMVAVRAAVARAAARYGVQLVDVRITRAALPDGAPTDGALARMRDAQQSQARTIDADGRRAAQAVMAGADADAARLYAESFGRDAAFYDFYRAMQSYRITFGTDDDGPRGAASIVLGPNSDYLRQFHGSGKP